MGGVAKTLRGVEQQVVEVSLLCAACGTREDMTAAVVSGSMKLV